MNKFFIVIVIIAIVAGGAYFILKSSQEPDMTDSGLDLDRVDVVNKEEKIITYTDTGYSPSSLEIETGDIVIFKNNSSQSMWPASAMHPAHNEYPTTGGCLGSTFDACKGVQPGDSWSFKFDISGTWKYHDHLSPKNFGAITVQHYGKN